MGPEYARVVSDPKLTPDAVRLILFVASLGEGEHEIEVEQLCILLGCRAEKPIVAARKRAEHCGYLRWRQGGKGHANRYEYIAPTGEVNAIPLPQGGGKPPLVVGRKEVDTPPNSPPVEIGPLADDARTLIESERDLLGDAVKPLISYLRRRVKPESQEPYAGRVVGALKPECMNPQWRDATGAVIPVARRPAIMADALNELATANEQTNRKWDPGDWGNMRNKLNGLIREENAPPVRATGTDGRRSRDGPNRKKAIDEQEYTPKPFRGLNG